MRFSRPPHRRQPATVGADTFVSVAGADFVLTFDFDVSFKVGNTV
jgi:hypothetical protein